MDISIPRHLRMFLNQSKLMLGQIYFSTEILWKATWRQLCNIFQMKTMHCSFPFLKVCALHLHFLVYRERILSWWFNFASSTEFETVAHTRRHLWLSCVCWDLQRTFTRRILALPSVVFTRKHQNRLGTGMKKASLHLFQFLLHSVRERSAIWPRVFYNARFCWSVKCCQRELITTSKLTECLEVPTILWMWVFVVNHPSFQESVFLAGLFTRITIVIAVWYVSCAGRSGAWAHCRRPKRRSQSTPTVSPQTDAATCWSVTPPVRVSRCWAPVASTLAPSSGKPIRWAFCVVISTGKLVRKPCFLWRIFSGAMRTALSLSPSVSVKS